MPDLAEIARDPSLAASLSVAERERIMLQIASVLASLATGQGPHGRDRLLTPEETATLLGMSLRWVQENAKGELAACRVTLSKNLRFSEMALLQLIARRRGG